MTKTSAHGLRMIVARSQGRASGAALSKLPRRGREVDGSSSVEGHARKTWRKGNKLPCIQSSEPIAHSLPSPHWAALRDGDSKTPRTVAQMGTPGSPLKASTPALVERLRPMQITSEMQSRVIQKTSYYEWCISLREWHQQHAHR